VPVPLCHQTSSAECFERWQADVKINAQPVGYNLNPTGKAGEVKVSFDVPSPGGVYVRAWTEGGELVSVEAERTDIVSEAPTILLEEDIPSQVNYGNNRFEFQLYAPSNDPELDKVALDVDPSSITVEVTYPDAHEETVQVNKQGTGRYYFMVPMDKELGQHYIFSITAMHSTWALYTTPDIHVNAMSKTIDPMPNTDWVMFAVAGLVIVALAVVIMTRRKKR
jgi:hypothetical protein